MEAGNRCFDQRMPEETNRRIIDASDVLARLGLEAGGWRLAAGGWRLAAGGYFVVSAHREENIESEQSFTKLVAVLNVVAEDYGLPVIAPHCDKAPDWHPGYEAR